MKKKILSLILIFIIFFFFIYLILPSGYLNFNRDKNFNFTLFDEKMQFYDNMRYSDSNISYKIYDCPLQKTNDMERAFDILSNETVLYFYEVDFDEVISVRCDTSKKIDEGLFIGGEGGPTKIIESDKFNVILNGQILLIEDLRCRNPNIALHELLHTFGFKHSINPYNVMYNISKCSQEIGDDVINFINELYEVESYPDLSFENISARVHGEYLDLNFSVFNSGLSDSKEFDVKIYSDENLIKTIEIELLKVGYGYFSSLKNIPIKDLKIKKIKLVLDYKFNELEKENNLGIYDYSSKSNESSSSKNSLSSSSS